MSPNAATAGRGALLAAVVAISTLGAAAARAERPVPKDPIHIVRKDGTVRISIDGSALFAGASSGTLRDSADEVLERVVPLIEESDGPVVVVGFNRQANAKTPARGWRRRAKAVADWLHAHGGIPRKRLRIKAPSVVRPSGRPAPATIVIKAKRPKES